MMMVSVKFVESFTIQSQNISEFGLGFGFVINAVICTPFRVPVGTSVLLTPSFTDTVLASLQAGTYFQLLWTPR
jgi:hypothetical protein